MTGSSSLSQRISQVGASPTLALTARAKQLKAQGVDVISLAAGEPDFDTPQHIKEAAWEALQKGLTKYTPTAGIPELREAVAEKLERENGLKYSPSQIIITCGAKQALYSALQVLCDPGDEVIIPAPYWVTYPEQARLAEAEPVIVETQASNNFKLQPDELKKVLTPRSKVLILNSPNNPSGAVYTEEELARIAEVCLEAGLWILSDEVYEKMVYDGRKHVSIASISEEVKRKTIVINALSKTYSMTGWRIGYAAGPMDVISAMNRLQSHSVSHPASFAQYAAVAALKGDQSCVEEMVQAFARRRKLILELMDSIPELECSPPEGAFYVFPRVVNVWSSLWQGKPVEDSITLCQYLLEEAKVAAIPGSAFGAEHHIRISYAASEEDIERGMERIRDALTRLREGVSG